MFGALLRLCGLSAGTAGIYLGVTRRQVANWIMDNEIPPQEHVYKIYALFDALEREVDRVIEEWEAAGRPSQIAYPIAADDEKAREAGWPCVATQMTAAAMTQATLTEVSVGFDVRD